MTNTAVTKAASSSFLSIFFGRDKYTKELNERTKAIDARLIVIEEEMKNVKQGHEATIASLTQEVEKQRVELASTNTAFAALNEKYKQLEAQMQEHSEKLTASKPVGENLVLEKQTESEKTEEPGTPPVAPSPDSGSTKSGRGWPFRRNTRRSTTDEGFSA